MITDKPDSWKYAEHVSWILVGYCLGYAAYTMLQCGLYLYGWGK